MIADKFVNVEILVPYPKNNVFIKDDISNLTERLHALWTMTNYGCRKYTNFSDGLAMKHVRLIETLQKEDNQAQHDIHNLHLEIADLLSAHTKTESHSYPSLSRPRRAIAAVPLALSLGATIGGFAAGDSHKCALKSYFGGCGSKQNKAKI